MILDKMEGAGFSLEVTEAGKLKVVGMLSESQRAMVAGKIANMKSGTRTDLEPSANLHEVSRAKAAEQLNVSERSVAAAKKVQSQGVDELIDRVEQGVISVSTAAKIAAIPEDEQEEIVEEIDAGAKPAEVIKEREQRRELEADYQGRRCVKAEANEDE